MTKVFKCRDIGMQCDFTARAETEEALMPQIAEHARSVHSIQTPDDAMLAKIKAAIKDE